MTDHHEIGETLPDAFAIVHPMHPNFEYPFKYLCGAVLLINWPKD